jgi:AraC-like DNA-binding protein
MACEHSTFDQSDSVRQRYAFGELADHHKALSQREYAIPTSDAAVAQVAGLSVCHFARMFKQTVGISPHRYVLQCRVEWARELLAGTDMPLSEIAIVTGFSDQSHYTRWFREITGITPGSYRWSTR